MAGYYVRYQTDGREEGPLDAHTIRERVRHGEITRDDRFSPDGERWARAERVGGPTFPDDSARDRVSGTADEPEPRATPASDDRAPVSPVSTSQPAAEARTAGASATSREVPTVEGTGPHRSVVDAAAPRPKPANTGDGGTGASGGGSASVARARRAAEGRDGGAVAMPDMNFSGGLGRALAVALCALIALAASTLLPWVRLGFGGIAAIDGDGKWLFAGALVAATALALAVVKRRAITPLVLTLAVAAGVVFGWCAAMVWRLNTLASAGELKDNPFAILIASQVGAGNGLYLAVAAAAVTAVALAYASTRGLMATQTPPRLIAAQLVAVGVGVGLMAYEGVDKPRALGGDEDKAGTKAQGAAAPEDGSGVASAASVAERLAAMVEPGASATSGDTAAAEGDGGDVPSAAEAATAEAYRQHVAIEHLRVADTTGGRHGVFGEVHNTGERTLKRVRIRIYRLDADGTAVGEETYPVVTDRRSVFSVRDAMPLRPGYYQPFGYRLEASSDFAGRVRANVVEVAFGGGGGEPAYADDPAKAGYAERINLRDIRTGDSAAGRPTVFGEVKNTGDRTIAEVEIRVYALNDAGARIFEKRFHALLADDSGYRLDPDNPLKPNYTETFGLRLEELPRAWSGDVEVVLEDFAFESTNRG